METHTNIYVCVCVRVYSHTYIWDSDTCPQRRFNVSLSPPDRLWGVRDVSWYAQGTDSVRADGLLWPPPQAHTCTALGAAIYLDRRDGAVHVVRRSCGSRRQTTSHKCKQKHTWRRLAPRPAALWAVRCGTVVRYEIFFLIPLHCKGYIFSLHPESWVRFCSHYYSLELTLKWI